ncbi:MAG: hypothetical protein VW686_05945, partial [Luminiphilus sp.]
GTHFIRLDERIAGETVSFDDVKEELRSSIESAEAERALLVKVEELRDLVFNAPDLSDPAETIGAAVARSEAFSRESGSGLFSEDALRQMAFSDDVLNARNNSEVVELSGRRFAVLRINEVKPAQVAPFLEVEAEIRERLRTELAAEALADLQTRAEQNLGDGASLEEVATSLGLEWRVELATTRLASQLPRPVLEAAFAMPAGEPATLRAVAVPGDGYAMVQLARVTPGSVNSLTRTETDSLLTRRNAEQQRLSFGEYLKYQRDVADIVIR